MEIMRKCYTRLSRWLRKTEKKSITITGIRVKIQTRYLQNMNLKLSPWHSISWVKFETSVIQNTKLQRDEGFEILNVQKAPHAMHNH